MSSRPLKHAARSDSIDLHLDLHPVVVESAQQPRDFPATFLNFQELVLLGLGESVLHPPPVHSDVRARLAQLEGERVGFKEGVRPDGVGARGWCLKRKSICVFYTRTTKKTF